MVDATDLKSVDFGHAGSTPASGTIYKMSIFQLIIDFLAKTLIWGIARKSAVATPSLQIKLQI